ncbi:Serine/threonine-protein phosphatase 4 catalytic subunit [Ogataea parapolymorpha DL-1]|uniref:Serine/threonine-protein phosphatase n=1 Tax=Ogataea parapolymorpha (strain ATCC 26012 / BCRC 20466 / JCM 22074 / NRRL Y-7560 / DL-1) TaxID=871575 RepID=W1QH40_OGAPD|nr:Serine/threonine-protein phosphatase 4 catalytic subunit [Ogataea parapolymorpha DL-1]ESX01362.1 Serine/threonine-protein phosphatase 4 catalytic subunit [Ogataea parapolymorpha DL-1]
MLHIDKIIQDVRKCKIVPENDIQELCFLAQELLIQESNIQLVDPPVTICGDIHGQLHDLLRLFKISNEPPHTKYLFLGDFVDRGFYSLETFLLLLCYKVRYPDRIFLIRGNHESRQITSVYGFYDECMRKYGSANVWRYCCDVFDYLALGAYILSGASADGGVLCVHGGLSPAIETIDEIRLIDRKQEVPHDGLMCDLLWSDPEENIPAWAVSPRGAGYLFGYTETERFLFKNNLSLIARAHQLVMEGYKEVFDGGLVTVWSAPNYCYRCGNVAAVLTLDDNLNRNYTVFDSMLQDCSEIPSKKPVADYFL